MRQHRLGHADALQRAQALVVHADGTRVVDQLVAALEQDGLDAVQAEHAGDGEADRAGAGDDDVGIEAGVFVHVADS